VDYIDTHKDRFGVEPICRTLSSAAVTIAPSTYYAAKTRPVSARAARDAQLTEQVVRVHRENFGVSAASGHTRGPRRPSGDVANLAAHRRRR
jgi:putative transposase